MILKNPVEEYKSLYEQSSIADENQHLEQKKSQKKVTINSSVEFEDSPSEISMRMRKSIQDAEESPSP